MAGKGFHFSLAAPDVWKEAARKLERLALMELEPLHREIGEYLVAQTADRFRESNDPGGRAWPELKRPRRRKSKKKKRGKVKLLIATGQLRKSISYRASAESVRVGSNLVYAARHNFGFEEGGKVLTPQRQFLGIGSRQQDEIVEIVSDYLQEL